MEYFLALNDAKAGPFTLYRVGELLDEGTADADTLAWHRGLDGWKPLREIPSLEAIRKRHLDPPETPSATPVPIGDPGHSPQPFPPADPLPVNPLPEVGGAGSAVVLEAAARPGHPFLRFWARTFDYLLVIVIVIFATGFESPKPIPGEPFAEALARLTEAMKSPEGLIYARTLIFSLLGWHVVEAVLIHIFGTTPGKWLFGIRVLSREKDRLSPGLSLARSFYVYAAGTGFFIFPLFLIGIVFGLIPLLTMGRSLWDLHLGSRVEHAPLGIVRIVLAIFAVFALFTLPALRFS